MKLQKQWKSDKINVKKEINKVEKNAVKGLNKPIWKDRLGNVWQDQGW